MQCFTVYKHLKIRTTEQVVLLSHVQLCVTPWVAAHQTPLSMGLSRQESCSGLHFLLHRTNYTIKQNKQKKTHVCMFKASQVRLLVKNPPANAGRHKRHRFHPWVRKIPWRRACPFTLAFSPGESHAQRSLVGYNPWGCIESDTTKAT